MDKPQIIFSKKIFCNEMNSYKNSPDYGNYVADPRDDAPV